MLGNCQTTSVNWMLNINWWDLYNCTRLVSKAWGLKLSPKAAATTWFSNWTQVRRTSSPFSWRATSWIFYTEANAEAPIHELTERSLLMKSTNYHRTEGRHGLQRRNLDSRWWLGNIVACWRRKFCIVLKIWIGGMQGAITVNTNELQTDSANSRDAAKTERGWVLFLVGSCIVQYTWFC